MSINQRLSDFIKALNSNPTALSNYIGVSQTSILNIIKGENLPSSKVLIPLKEKYALLNMNWLLSGKGDMMLDKTESNQENINNKDEIIKIQKDSIADLRGTIELLTKNLAEKETQIKKLKEKSA